MKVVVVEKIMHVAIPETFSAQVGTVTISMTGKLYHCYTTTLGVYASTDTASEAIKDEKLVIIEMLGEKALDDEDIDDMHTFLLLLQ